MQIKIRSFIPEDLNFILNSWLHSFRDCSRFAQTIPDHIYNKYHSLVIQRILERKVDCLIASDEEEKGLIYGYAVFEKNLKQDIFHYVYVKRAFNLQGIAKKLIKEAPFKVEHAYASHMTAIKHKDQGIFCLVKHLNLIHCPYLV